MRRFVLLPLLATLLVTPRAQAVGLFSGGKPALIHEDYVFLHQDVASKREHVLFVARVAPAFRRVQFGLPTPSTPTLEQVVVDLPDALHKLIAPHEMRAKKHAPVPPVPWMPDEARLDFFTETRLSADHVFDEAWTKSYVDKGFSIAGMGVVTPEDGRVEVLSPSVFISFESERLVFSRREPSLPVVANDDSAVDLPDKPASIVEITVSHLEPRTVGIKEEAIAEVMRSGPEPLMKCYEAFLERHPDTKWAQSFEATARPNGHNANIKVLDGQTDADNQNLTSCVTKVLQTKRTPRTIDGYNFQVRVSFRPPHVPGRRTHIVVLGSSKYVWPNQPATVHLEEDFEILPLDLRLALPERIQRSLNIRPDERIWVSHWVDRSIRRTEAEDVEFVRQELPALGEPGALPQEVHDADLDRAKPPVTKSISSRHSRKNRKLFALLGILGITMFVALGLFRSEYRG